MDIRDAIAPKSDQLNSDDLIGQSLTVTITKVVITAGEQPVSIYFDGDRGKPYKPCKSMCRVMVQAWGNDTAKYAGRSMTLYRDPSVKWGGMEVGGIRISHMSDLDSRLSMALTATKGVKKVFTVQPLAAVKTVVNPDKLHKPPASDPAADDGDVAPEPWPMLKPDASVIKAPSAERWAAWCRAALAKLPDTPDVDGWIMAMEPHFTALAERDADTVAAVKRAAGDRRKAIMEAKEE